MTHPRAQGGNGLRAPSSFIGVCLAQMDLAFDPETRRRPPCERRTTRRLTTSFPPILNPKQTPMSASHSQSQRPTTPSSSQGP